MVCWSQYRYVDQSMSIVSDGCVLSIVLFIYNQFSFNLICCCDFSWIEIILWYTFPNSWECALWECHEVTVSVLLLKFTLLMLMMWVSFCTLIHCTWKKRYKIGCNLQYFTSILMSCYILKQFNCFTSCGQNQVLPDWGHIYIKLLMSYTEWNTSVVKNI